MAAVVAVVAGMASHGPQALGRPPTGGGAKGQLGHGAPGGPVGVGVPEEYALGDQLVQLLAGLS